MKKRIFALILAAALLMTGAALAQSLFPALPVQETEEAPNFGIVLNKNALLVENLEDGSTVYTYAPVTQEDFNVFGVYLNEKGFALGNSRYVGNALEAQVQKGEISFQVFFDWEKQSLKVTYPQGVEVEKKSLLHYFPDHTVLSMGDTVKIDGVVKMQLNEFGKYELAYGFGSFPCLYTTCTSLTAADKQFFPGDKIGRSIDMKVHYISEDGEFVFDVALAGILSKTVTMTTIQQEWGIRGMNSAEVGITFGLPEEVLDNPSGMLALTIAHEGSKYVLPIRE